MTQDQQPPIWLEVTSALLVPAACVGFSRVFLDASTILPIVGASLLSSAVAVLARRLRIPLIGATLISLGLLSALIINRYAPGTARLGVIPTGATADQLRLVFDELISNFQELKTPVPALQPFVAASMIGAWIMAFLTDWGAMRLRLAFEPVLPSALLFIFTSIPPVSAGGNVLISTVVFGAGVAAWAVSQRAANLLQRGVWLANDHRRGPLNIGTTGAVVAAIAVIAGSLIGGRLPGAGADPVYSFKDQGDPTRVVVSPFVNIRSRLVSQTTQELFTVSTDKPSYWRIAGLDTYEDDIWKVAGDFSPETGRLPGQRDFDGAITEVTQDFSVSALRAIWLPAAFAPSEITDATAEVTWNAENSSLTVANDVENSDGVSYSLVSNVPAFSVEQLQAGSEFIPQDVAERYLSLPSNLSPIVQEQALTLTSGFETRYDKMRALQDHFRGYAYNVQLGPRQGDPIEQFLAEREGFCQQFAGTFALMARSLGVPARVATGFTWGDPTGPADPETGFTTYSVTGRQTHAWPEVYFDDLGWVAFEPTPGRGLPGAASYTGVAAEQSSDVQPNNPGQPTTTTTIDPNNAPGVSVDPGIEDFFGDEFIEPVDTGVGGGFSIPWRLVLPILALAAYAIGMPLIWHLRRSARRNKATTPARRVETAWAEAVESLELGFDIRRQPAETRTEYAGRLETDRRVPSSEFTTLAETATVARFHPGGVTDLKAEQADQLSTRIETAVNNRVPIYARYRRLLDPRRLLKPTKRIVTETTAANLSSSGDRPDDRELVETGA
ncbi:MAG: transglutaminase TgpA family protein [Acidimicrobiales bacterium]